MTDLLPCPFCSGSAWLFKKQDESLYHHGIVWFSQINCRECDASGPYVCDDPEGSESTKLWNARATHGGDRTHLAFDKAHADCTDCNGTTCAMNCSGKENV